MTQVKGAATSFYKTLPFFILLLALLATTTLLIINIISQKRLKIKLDLYKRQHEMEKERLRISREIHDNIGESLNQITLIRESISRSTTTEQKEVAEIAETSRKLVKSIGEIIWSMSTGDNTLHDLFEYLRENLYELLDYSGMAFHIFFPTEDTRTVYLTIEQRRNILLVVKEIVHNAITHSKGREIIIKAVMIRHGVQFFISDNGTGFDTEKYADSHGIKNINQRIADLGGRLTLIAEANSGTHYTFFIPSKPGI